MMVKPLALPAFAFTIAALSCSASLDEDTWPAVHPEFKTPSPYVVRGAYFRGRMLKSPKGKCADGVREYIFRRTVVLKAKPVEAWVQFSAIGGGGSFVRLNGKVAARNGDWMHPTVANADGMLKEGRNEVEIVYPWRAMTKGVLAELFVRYQDGSHERIDTDSSFRVSADGGKTWDDAVEQMPPPAIPWVYSRRPAYVDFAHLQKFVSGSVEPREVSAGGKAWVTFKFDGPMPAAPLDICVAIRRGGGDHWWEQITLGAECVKENGSGGWTLRFPYEMPLYISGGEFDFVIDAGLSCASGAVAKAAFTCRRAESIKGFEKRVRADVRDVAGAAQFHLDGKPFFALWGRANRRRRPDRLPRHSSAPLSVITVESSDYSARDAWWPSEDGFEPAVFDRQAEQYRREYGDDAYFMWNIELYPPKDWIERHPGEMCLDDKGDLVRDGECPYSFASKPALDAMEKALVKALRYIESSPYANRIIGYRINSGHYTEWLGLDPPPGRWTDFSPAAQRGFAEYVKANHPDWSDCGVPTPAERFSDDPAARAKCTAYYDFYSRAIADDIIRLMRKAREVVGEGRLLGTYWGYTMSIPGSGRSQMRAHFALRHLLDAKAVDYLMSPQPYGIRRIGDTCGEIKPFSSIAANGVVPVVEDDTRTSNGSYNGDNWQTHTLSQSIGVVRRNAGAMLCRGEPVFFFALCEGTEFDFPEFAADMAKVRKVGEWCLATGTSRGAEVAYVVSEEDVKAAPIKDGKREPAGFSTQRYTPDGSVKVEKVMYLPGFSDVFNLNYHEMSRSGAPVDYVLAEDLARHPGSYKLYIEPDIIAGKIRFRTAAGVTEGDTLLKVNDLRERYARAGVHVYCDTDDPVEANGSLFTLHARRAGKKTVTLPRRTTVLDVYNARIVARDADTFTFDAPLHSSWLFYYGDDAEALADSLGR